MADNAIKKSDNKTNEERFSRTHPVIKNTTMALTEINYNFLLGVRYYEMTTLANNINMSDVLNKALEQYREFYEREHNIKITERGKVQELGEVK